MSDLYRYYESGKLDERERIIKLLEYLASANSKYCTIPLDRNHCQSCWATADTIAFIKGEQK
jgi:hypothetical protein